MKIQVLDTSTGRYQDVLENDYIRIINNQHHFKIRKDGEGIKISCDNAALLTLESSNTFTINERL